MAFRSLKTGKIRSIAKGGQGIANVEGLPVFIPGVLPGETVEFTLLSKNKQYGRGKAVNITHPSPFRIPPSCPHYMECGGCNFQHISYQQQLHYKLEILSSNLRKIARIIRPPDIIAIESQPFKYRSRVEFQIRDGCVGFFRRDSSEFYPIQECHIIPENISAFILDNRGLFSDCREGRLHVVGDGSTLSAVLLSEGEKRYLTVKRDVIFTLTPFRLRVGPLNFLQANLFTLKSMIQVLEKEMMGQIYRSIADLFSGIGFFTLPACFHSREVYALEIDEENIDCLRLNLRLNQRRAVQVYQKDIYTSEIPSAELMIADPPRTGLGPELIKRISSKEPRKLIYYSCDSATFSRDARNLIQNGMHLKTLNLIDNFPQTDHFEIFSSWER